MLESRALVYGQQVEPMPLAATVLPARVVATLAVAIAAGACSSTDRTTSTTPDDMVAISRLLVTMDRLASEADWEGLLGHFSEDAVLMPAREAPRVGRARIASWYQGLSSLYRMETSHEPLETDVFGPVVIHRGVARRVLAPRSDAVPFSFEEEYLFVLRRDSSGATRIWRAIYTPSRSGAPATAADTALLGEPVGDRAATARYDRAYGRPNPQAPEELAQFAFLIGTWRCESKIKRPDGEYTTHPAEWIGRYILDGYVIADEFRQFGPNGELTQLGETYRAYDAASGSWVMRWHDALTASWLDLGPADLGGVQVSDSSITFRHRVPPDLPTELFPPHALFRVSFSDISGDHFTWRAEVSRDGGGEWEQVQVIEAYRADG